MNLGCRSSRRYAGRRTAPTERRPIKVNDCAMPAWVSVITWSSIAITVGGCVDRWVGQRANPGASCSGITDRHVWFDGGFVNLAGEVAPIATVRTSPSRRTTQRRRCVGTPAVGCPNVRASGRPRSAITTPSPELAVPGPCSTASAIEHEPDGVAALGRRPAIGNDGTVVVDDPRVGTAVTVSIPEQRPGTEQRGQGGEHRVQVAATVGAQVDDPSAGSRAQSTSRATLYVVGTPQVVAGEGGAYRSRPTKRH